MSYFCNIFTSLIIYTVDELFQIVSIYRTHLYRPAVAKEWGVVRHGPINLCHLIIKLIVRQRS